MKIAITGGSGFIGRATVAAAEQRGHDVVLFDRPDCDILGDLDGLAGAKHIIHLAGVLGTAELFETPELAVQVNVVGTLRILQWCEANGAGYTGITMPPVFPSVYTATKTCATRLATAWHHSRGVPVSHVRAFNAYGPGQKHGPGHPQKILPTFAVEAWNNRPIPIWGSGDQTTDLVHAADLGRMLVDATKYGDDQIFDGGTGTPVPVNELAQFVIEVTGSTAGIQRMPMRAGEVETYIRASGRGWGTLGWRPHHSWLHIREAIESYKRWTP